MPLAPAGSRGYPSWQRISNFDTGALWQSSSNPTNTTVQSPVLDVSRFEYFAGSFYTPSGMFFAQVNWYLDAAATILAGQRTFIVNGLIANPAQVRMLNLGAFVRVTLFPITALSYQPQVFVFATNRAYPIDFMPIAPQLITQNAQAIAANGSVFAYPTDYYAGPIGVWLSNQFASGTYNLQMLDSGGNWQFVDQRILTVSASQYFVDVAPPGAWRVWINNTTGGANTYYLSVTPSLTGAT